jgi:hypothetical protein
MKIFVLLSILILWTGCVHFVRITETDKIKRDLIGHTMGGRESSWKFQSLDQIKDLKIEKRVPSGYIVLLILRDSRILKSFEARALLTYENCRLITVGELSIKQING